MFNVIAKTLKRFSLNATGALHSFAALSFVTLICFLAAEPSFAQDLSALDPTTIDIGTDVNKVAENIVDNVSRLPWLISSLAYLTGIYFGVVGVNKLRQHVENPAQTKLSSATARFLGGGALLALPTVYAAMYNIVGDQNEGAAFSFSATNFMSAIFGDLAGIMGDIGITRDFNAVLSTFLNSISDLPHLISAFAYLLGLYLGFLAVLKLKDHIEDPDRNPMKEAFLRFFIGACFLALPSIYAVMKTAISGDGVDITGIIASLFNAYGFLESTYDPSRGCTTDILSGVADSMTMGLLDVSGTKSLGTAICQFYGHMISLPAFLTAISQLLGYLFGFWGLLKLRDHMADPRSTPISQAVKRFIAGGAFLSIQSLIAIVRSTTTPVASTVDGLLQDTTSGYAGIPSSCGLGEDMIDGLVDEALSSVGLGGSGGSDSSDTATGFGKTVYCAVSDILGPIETSLNFFTFVAGLIFLMIGISRLLKSEQDGPRAPAGLGTIGTFVTAGVLFSFSDFVRIITMNIFTIGTTTTQASLKAVADGDQADYAEFYATVSGILQFMMIIGLISFARGIFILRGVSEGNQQSSMMAGVTHIIGGTLAVNLGPLLNLIQTTLGITSYGMTFS